MEDLSERLDGIRLRVSAPGADIKAEMRNRGDLDLEFGESVYEFINERALEGALASIARLLWASWRREYRLVIDETGLNVDPDDQHDRNFYAERKALEVEGKSADERITVAATGMENFIVRVEPGTVNTLSEREFAAGAKQAAAKVIRDFQIQTRKLKRQYYTR